MKISPAFLALMLLLASSAWSADLELTSSEERQLHASRPYFNRNLGRVTLEADNACLYCGNFSPSFYRSSKEEILDRLFSAKQLLKAQLQASGVFTDASDNKLGLRVTVLSMVHDSSDGNNDKFSISSGVSMITQVKLNYELLDKTNVVASWQISTKATSNSVGQHDRIIESTDIALTRNIRAFILKLKMDYDPTESSEARESLAELDGETDNTRSILGYLVVGGAVTGQAAIKTASVVSKGMADACRSDPSCANGEGSRRAQANLDATIANSNRQNAEMYERGVRQRQQQIQNDRAEQKDRAESDAAWAKLNQPRSTSVTSARSSAQPQIQTYNYQAQGNTGASQQDQERQRKEAQVQLNAKQQARNRNDEQLQQQARVQPRNSPSLASVSNSGSSRNSSNQQVSNTPKQSTAATRTVTAEGDSELCHSRPTAESQARVGAELDARKECEALGEGWGFDKEKVRFAGYLGCTPCTSRWEQGNFRCKVTQAMYNCRHR